MMKMMKSILVIVIMGMVMKGTAAASLTVGDAEGWKVPSSPDFYSSWAAKQTFSVGDTLVFNFVGGHTVATVTKKDEYDNCDSTHAPNISGKNPTTIPLPSEGTYFFFCTVGSHCAQGQKLTVTVNPTSSGSGSGSGSPSPPGSGSGPTVGSPPQTPAAPPPPPTPPTPTPYKSSAPKPMALTCATLSTFLGALVFAF